MGSFQMPPVPGFSSNVGLGLSEGGRLLAYADVNVAVIYEVGTDKKPTPWPLGKRAWGNRVAYLGDGRFRLVREEVEKHDRGERWEGAAYELKGWQGRPGHSAGGALGRARRTRILHE